MGFESSKCSEMSPSRGGERVGAGVLESEGAMARGRPRRMDVPRSCISTIAHSRMRSWHSSSLKIG